MSFCGKCGVENTEGAKFCKSCGSQLMNEDVGVFQKEKTYSQQNYERLAQSNYYGSSVSNAYQPASSAPLVFGILSMVFGIVLGIFFGLIALVSAASSRRRSGPNGKATAGTVLGAIGMGEGLFALVYLLLIGGLFGSIFGMTCAPQSFY